LPHPVYGISYWKKSREVEGMLKEFNIMQNNWGEIWPWLLKMKEATQSVEEPEK